jgi:CRISPR system Cascade subunit CasB
MTATAVVPDNSPPSSPAREWWAAVCKPDAGDPAARARLRRCRNTIDVLSIPEGIRLARMLGDMPRRGPDDFRFSRALDLARVLANVKEDRSTHPMRDVGWPTFPGARRDGEGERPALSEARFRRLLQTETGEELVTQFTRLVALMDGRANVAALSDAFRWWSHPEGWVKRRWAFEYFNAANAMPISQEPLNVAAEEPTK